MVQAHPDLNKHDVLYRSPTKEWLAKMRNTFDKLLPDQQQALRDDPIRLCPDDAAVRQVKSAKDIMKTRNELEKFQRIYGNGTRPNPSTWGTPDDKKLGKRIANHILSFRVQVTKEGKNSSYHPLNKEILQLYRELNIKEFQDGTDETNYTLLTRENFEEWCEQQGLRISKRGVQGGEASDEESDTLNIRRRRTRSVTKGTTAATSTDSGTSEPTAKKRKKKAASCEWTDDEVKELENLVKKYGSEWSLFVGMNYISGKTAAQMRCKWVNVEKKRVKEMNKNKKELRSMLLQMKKG